ncbi:MAG: hypothetical protein D6760_03500 [Deltaproteobacteria bacterium]|nr:MAG: hypothetical protein D6760_03500 [Deltaproteobacteria bacterium]
MITAISSLAWCLALAACGVGGGTKAALPAGPATTAPPGDQVLYVALAQGNRIEAYRLGNDGLLPRRPFSSIDVVNPRRLLLAGGVLYAALDDRIVSIKLAADGSLPSRPSAETKPFRGADYRDLVLVDDVLYAAAPGLRRVQALPLESGHVPLEALSNSGTGLSDYISLAAANGFVYAGSPTAVRIDTYIIGSDGSLPDQPEPQVPETFVDFPQRMEVRGATLFVIELGDQRISAFPIRTNGLPADEPDSQTRPVERYADLVLAGDRLYASAFNAGRVDVYPLDPVTDALPDAQPAVSTAADPAAFPSGMILSGGILYVAQAGISRIDGYILGSDGMPPPYPSTSTSAVSGGFMTDLAIGTFPPN